jgi:hypothetical protein
MSAKEEWDVVPRIAGVTALAAQRQGLAQLGLTREQLIQEATSRIQTVRDGVRLFMKEGVIPPVRPV